MNFAHFSIAALLDADGYLELCTGFVDLQKWSTFHSGYMTALLPTSRGGAPWTTTSFLAFIQLLNLFAGDAFGQVAMLTPCWHGEAFLRWEVAFLRSEQGCLASFCGVKDPHKICSAFAGVPLHSVT
mmetsp:Transcript_20590/g.37024  ORF Transcript_20590/g.37024 Transcript_20590/m.37024 type:complete len:127 (+) Transcript_20590:76-456(+)